MPLSGATRLTRNCCSTWRTNGEAESPRWQKMVPLPSFLSEAPPSLKCQGPQSRCPAHHCSSQPPRATPVTHSCPRRPEPGKPLSACFAVAVTGLCGSPLTIENLWNVYSIGTSPTRAKSLPHSLVFPLSSIIALNSPSSKLSRCHEVTYKEATVQDSCCVSDPT